MYKLTAYNTNSSLLPLAAALQYEQSMYVYFMGADGIFVQLPEDMDKTVCRMELTEAVLPVLYADSTNVAKIKNGLLLYSCNSYYFTICTPKENTTLSLTDISMQTGTHICVEIKKSRKTKSEKNRAKQSVLESVSYYEAHKYFDEIIGNELFLMKITVHHPMYTGADRAVRAINSCMKQEAFFTREKPHFIATADEVNILTALHTDNAIMKNQYHTDAFMFDNFYIDHSDGIQLGADINSRIISLPVEDFRTNHAAITGLSRYGKTSMALNIIRQLHDKDKTCVIFTFDPVKNELARYGRTYRIGNTMTNLPINIMDTNGLDRYDHIQRFLNIAAQPLNLDDVLKNIFSQGMHRAYTNRNRTPKGLKSGVMDYLNSTDYRPDVKMHLNAMIETRLSALFTGSANTVFGQDVSTDFNGFFSGKERIFNITFSYLDNSLKQLYTLLFIDNLRIAVKKLRAFGYTQHVYIVMDELHAFIGHNNENTAIMNLLQSMLAECMHEGISVMLIDQRPQVISRLLHQTPVQIHFANMGGDDVATLTTTTRLTDNMAAAVQNLSRYQCIVTSPSVKSPVYVARTLPPPVSEYPYFYCHKLCPRGCNRQIHNAVIKDGTAIGQLHFGRPNIVRSVAKHVKELHPKYNSSSYTKCLTCWLLNQNVSYENNLKELSKDYNKIIDML